MKAILTTCLWERLWHNIDRANMSIIDAVVEDGDRDDVDLDKCIAHLESALSMARSLKQKETVEL